VNYVWKIVFNARILSAVKFAITIMFLTLNKFVGIQINKLKGIFYQMEHYNRVYKHVSTVLVFNHVINLMMDIILNKTKYQ
jgi:hypothetical protein